MECCQQLLVDATFYGADYGIKWRNLPGDFPHSRTRSSPGGGRTEASYAIHNALDDEVRRSEGRDTDPTAAIIDSQSVRAAEVLADSRGYNAGMGVHLVDGHGGAAIVRSGSPERLAVVAATGTLAWANNSQRIPRAMAGRRPRTPSGRCPACRSRDPSGRQGIGCSLSSAVSLPYDRASQSAVTFCPVSRDGCGTPGRW